MCFCAKSQVSNDSTNANGKYPFHLSRKPQNGYGLIFGYCGNERIDKISDGNKDKYFKTGTRNIYKIGILRTHSTDSEEDGTLYGNEGLSLEINDIKNKTTHYNPIYGFVAGVDGIGLSMFDIGLFVNYMTDFSTHRAFSLRPYIGFGYFDFINLQLGFTTELYIVNPNFDKIANAVVVFQFNLGVIKR